MNEDEALDMRQAVETLAHFSGLAVRALSRVWNDPHVAWDLLDQLGQDDYAALEGYIKDWKAGK